ncbi:MAG: replication factor C large subunit [archaeon]
MQNKSETWAEKYRAFSLDDFKGQDDAIFMLKKFIINFRHGKHAALIYGASGTGKTSMVYALARNLGFEVIELNASSMRSREQIESILNPASSQASLFAKSKVILIDEIDGISGKDRGGIDAIVGLIETTKYPIFITTNDAWQQKLNPLRHKTEMIEFKQINYNALAFILDVICRKEGLCINPELLKSIAVKCRGDVRAAINDLQSISQSTEIDTSCIYEREKDESIFNAMKKVFKAVKIDMSVIEAFDSVNVPIDDIFLWIEENIPAEYSGSDLANAYDALSIADVFRGRIHRQQHWRFLIYENAFLTAGIAAAKKQAKLEFTPYKRPSRILKIWMAKQRNAVKKSIAAKLASATHTSLKRALKDFYFYRIILQKGKIYADNLKLSDREMEFILEK